jgi:RNA recognition motif-containing protein
MSKVRLYIGGIPLTASASTLWKLFSSYGTVEAIELSENPGGYGFLTVSGIDPAARIIRTFHNKFKMDPENGFLQVRVVSRGESSPVRVFVGGIPASSSPTTVRAMLSQFGELVDLHIAIERGYAIAGYGRVEDAVAVVVALHGITLPGGIRPLDVHRAKTIRHHSRVSE